jgi:LysM repeat protein
VLSSTRARQERESPHQGLARQSPGPELISGLDWQLLAALVLLVLAALLALAAIVYPRLWIVPGVRTLGVELGGKTRAQAVSALQRNWQTRTVLLGHDEVIVSLAPEALGLSLDVHKTVQAAFVRGRSWEKLGIRLRGDHSFDVVPVLDLDLAVATETLQGLRPQIDALPEEAGLRLVNGRVEAVDPQMGRSFDLAKTLSQLEEQSLAVVETGYLALVVHPVPPLGIDVSKAVAQANEWLAHSLTIVAYDPVSDESLAWEVPPDQWAAWVSMKVNPDDPAQLQWTFDRRAALAALAAWETSLGANRFTESEQALPAIEEAIVGAGWRARLRVYHSSSQYTVQSGDTLSSISREVGIPYPWIQQANPGVSDSLTVGQVLTIPSPDVLLPLPVIDDKRIVIGLSAQRLWAYESDELLWEGPVSTGIASSPTALGVFQVQSHEPNAYAASWNLWMPYFMGIYRPVPTSDFMNGFHGFPTRDGAALLWTGSLGHPVTFGCILLGDTGAPLLYEWAEEGVVVEIRE